MDTGKTAEHLRTSSVKETPVYAKVDLSKKTKNRIQKRIIADKNSDSLIPDNCNYMNIRFKNEDENYKHLTNLNYMNLEFTNSLRFYENVRELLGNSKDKKQIDSLNIDLPSKISMDLKRRIRICHKCGHTSETRASDCNNDKPKPKKINYLALTENVFENYVPMSPLKLSSNKLSPEKSASNPILSETSLVLEKQRKTSIGIVGAKYSTLDSCSKYSDRVDIRKRSSSAGSPKHLELEVKDDSSSNGDSRIPVDSDSGLESDKLSQENDDTLENLRHRKDSILASGIRRLSSIACKSSNRDSSSSNDSGFSSGSLKYPCQDFTEFEMPLTTAGSSAKRHNSFNQHCIINSDRCSPTPRRAKSSDPLRDLTFHFHKGSVSPKSSSAEAELPLYLSRRELCKGKY